MKVSPLKVMILFALLITIVYNQADHNINSPAATQGSPPSYSPYEETWSVASNYESSFMHQRYVPPTPGSPSASTVSRSGRLSSYVSPSYPQYQPAPVNNGEASGIAVSIIVPTLPSARSSYFDSASTASTAGSSRCDLTPGLDTEDATAHGEQLDGGLLLIFFSTLLFTNNRLLVSFYSKCHNCYSSRNPPIFCSPSPAPRYARQ